jgi:hypothetical protein
MSMLTSKYLSFFVATVLAANVGCGAGSADLGESLGAAFDDGLADGLSGTVKGVSFTLEEGLTTLSLANYASREVLDDDAGIEARAATNIVAARPINTLAALASISLVGPTAIGKLKLFAPQWVAGRPTDRSCGLGGRFDGVFFTAAEECRALDAANAAGYLQLGLIDGGARRAIYDRRPWRSLREVAASSGVGEGAMKALLAISRNWVEGQSGAPDTVSFLVRTKPRTDAAGRAPQVTIDRAAFLSRVAGTPCVWIADVDASTAAQQRVQLCVSADSVEGDAQLRRALSARSVVRVRATFRLRDNGVPYLQASGDFVRITNEPL